MRVRNTIGLLLVFLTILVVALFITLKVTLLPIKFSSTHPNISVSRSESLLFNIYSNYVLKIKTTDMWGTKPKIVGVIYTDKIRPNNQVLDDNREVNFGSLISSTEDNTALLYIYISKNVIDDKDAKDKIKNYTIDTIKYFQQKEYIDNIFSKFIKLPVNVKNN